MSLHVILSRKFAYLHIFRSKNYWIYAIQVKNLGRAQGYCCCWLPVKVIKVPTGVPGYCRSNAPTCRRNITSFSQKLKIIFEGRKIYKDIFEDLVLSSSVHRFNHPQDRWFNMFMEI